MLAELVPREGSEGQRAPCLSPVSWLLLTVPSIAWLLEDITRLLEDIITPMSASVFKLLLSPCMSFSYKETSYIGLRPHLNKLHLLMNYIFNDSVSKESHILRDWRWGFQQIFLGCTVQPIVFDYVENMFHLVTWQWCKWVWNKFLHLDFVQRDQIMNYFDKFEF